MAILGASQLKFFIKSEGAEKAVKDTEKVTAAQKKAVRAVQSTTRVSTTQLDLGFVKLAVGAGIALVAINTVKRSIDQLRQNVAAFAEQETSVNRFNIALQSMGAFSRSASDEIRGFAKALELQSRFSDQAIISAAGLIAQLGRIRGEELKEATTGAVNLAVALKRDLKVGALIVAKAAQGSTFELRKYGLVIDRNIPKTERFAAVMAFLRDTFGGLAQDELPTIAVSFERLKNQFTDLRENLGRDFLVRFNIKPGLDFLIDQLVKINARFDALRDSSREVFDPLGPARGFNEFVDALAKVEEATVRVRKAQEATRDEFVKPVPEFDFSLKRAALNTLNQFRDVLDSAREGLGTVATGLDRVGASAENTGKFFGPVVRLFGLFKDKVIAPRFAIDPGDQLDLARQRVLAVLEELDDEKVFLRVATTLDLGAVRVLRSQLEGLKKRFGESSAEVQEFKDLMEAAISEGFLGRAIRLEGIFINIEGALAKFKQTAAERIDIRLDPKFEGAKREWEEFQENVERGRRFIQAQLTAVQAGFEGPLIEPPPPAFLEIITQLDNEKFKQQLEKFRARLGDIEKDYKDALNLEGVTVERAESLKKIFIAAVTELAERFRVEAGALSSILFGDILAAGGRLGIAIDAKADVILTKESVNRIDAFRNRFNKTIADLVPPDLLASIDFSLSPKLEPSLASIATTFALLQQFGTGKQQLDFFKQLAPLLQSIAKESPKAADRVKEFEKLELPKIKREAIAAVKLDIEVEDGLGPVLRALTEDRIALAKATENDLQQLRQLAGVTEADLQRLRQGALTGEDLVKVEGLIKTAQDVGFLNIAIDKLFDDLERGGNLTSLDKIDDVILQLRVNAITSGQATEYLTKRLAGLARRSAEVRAELSRNPLRGIEGIGQLNELIDASIDEQAFSDKLKGMRADLEVTKQEFLSFPERRSPELVLVITNKEKSVRALEDVEREIAEIKDGFKRLAAEGIAGILTAPLSSLLDETQTFSQAMVGAFKNMVDQIIAEIQRLIALKILKSILNLIAPGAGDAVEAGVNVGTSVSGATGKRGGPQKGGPLEPEPAPLGKPVLTPTADVSELIREISMSRPALSIDTTSAVSQLIREVELARPNVTARVGLTNPEVLAASVARSALPAFTSQPAVEFESVLPQSTPVNVQIVANDATSIERSITSGNFERAMTKVVRRARV